VPLQVDTLLSERLQLRREFFGGKANDLEQRAAHALERPERALLVGDLEPVQQGFDVMMSSNVRNLSMEYVTKIAEVIGTQLLTVDTMSTVQRDQLTQVLFEMIDPFIASRVLQPVEQASQKEADD
jgi:hypothetical protein